VDINSVERAQLLTFLDMITIQGGDDEHILPEPLIRSGNGRRFARLGAALASFYFTSEGVYTATLRRKVVEEVTVMLRARRDVESILALRPEFLWRYRLAY
jgi:hypothetical protein